MVLYVNGQEADFAVLVSLKTGSQDAISVPKARYVVGIKAVENYVVIDFITINWGENLYHKGLYVVVTEN